MAVIRKTYFRLAVVVCLVVMAAVTVIIVIGQTTHQPMYQGKPIIHWLTNESFFHLTENEALSAPWSNAVPYITKLISIKESQWGKIRRLYEAKFYAEGKLPDFLPLSVTTPWSAKRTLISLLDKVAQFEPHAIAPILAQALDDPDILTKMAAAHTLNYPELFTLETPGKLVEMLSAEQASCREAAVYALGNLGRTRPDLISLVQKGLTDQSIDARASAARSLWKMTGDADTTVRILIPILDHQWSWFAAAKYLGEMGPLESLTLKTHCI